MDESVSYLQLQSIANSATTFSGLLVCSLVVILFFSRFFSVSIWTSMPCSISFITADYTKMGYPVEYKFLYFGLCVALFLSNKFTILVYDRFSFG